MDAINVATDILAQPERVDANPTTIDPVSDMATLTWKAYAMFAWLLVALFLAFDLAFRFRHLRKEHGFDPSQEIPDWFKHTLESAALEIGCRRLPSVLLTHRVFCPAVFGLFRPVLLLPRDEMERMSQTTARHILITRTGAHQTP